MHRVPVPSVKQNEAQQSFLLFRRVQDMPWYLAPAAFRQAYGNGNVEKECIGPIAHMQRPPDTGSKVEAKCRSWEVWG
jgi:hypothetical protein